MPVRRKRPGTARAPRLAAQVATRVPAPAPLPASAAGASRPSAPVGPRHLPSQPPLPTQRLLRGYSFDPSLATRLETALVSEITYRVPWERLEPGPRGEYVEVVDFDPASDCFYAPVDLDDPAVLAQNGLAPSEGNPQFHQQMVYAVTMTTIDHFERALGRRAFWADRWQRGSSGEEEYIQRLRIYPHALRDANAFYSRTKMALLFGYFPATSDRSSGQYPGGLVFTGLSHDVVAHETTHALLDGFHEHFMEATNRDVLAFHEAFADIVALFQHFTFPDALRHQIARTRGDLGASENLLSQLAGQFGHATGTRGALRDAIGRWDLEQARWIPIKADPTALDRATEVHDRGAILVAAVFDAFLSIYHSHSRDLMRLATGGSGVLPQGELHPDLVDRLAREASKAAGRVLDICIRALDYCPPVDLTFGEYLRALITADIDLHPEDPHGYRVAFVEAFRRRGIYPGDVLTLSVDSLRWARPEEDPTLPPGQMEEMLRRFMIDIGLRDKVDRLRYKRSRREIWETMRGIRADLHDAIAGQVAKAAVLQRLTGLALAEYEAPPGVRVHRDGVPVFKVHSIREARRLADDGRLLNQVFVTLLQKEEVEHKGRRHTVRCGSTLVIDLGEHRVSYVVRKGLQDRGRLERTLEFLEGGLGFSPNKTAATYFGDSREIFAALHSDVHG